MPTIPQPLLFIIWHRAPGKRQRWKKAGRASTHAEAVSMIGGSGDWHIAPIYDPHLVGTLEASEPTAQPE